MRDLTIIQDGGVLLRDGAIVEVGTMRRLANLAAARGAVEIDATGKVVMPGFVDSHTHLLFPMPQSDHPHPSAAIDIARAAHRLEAVTTQRLAARGRVWLDTMARHGTTTVEVKTGCGPNYGAELKALRVLDLLNRGALDIVPTFLFRAETEENGGSPPEADDRLFRDLMFRIRRRRLALFADLQWDTDVTRRRLFVRFLEAALVSGSLRKIHADQRSCAGAVLLAVEYGVTSIDHLEYATLEQARLLATVPIVATLLPCASFFDGQHAPARTLLDAGVAIALGSNFNPRQTPALNMQTAICLACTQMGMTPAEAITAATINSAHALNAASRVGSLEVGKSADLLILDTSDYRDVAYQLGTNLVHTTVKNGKILCSRKDSNQK